MSNARAEFAEPAFAFVVCVAKFRNILQKYIPVGVYIYIYTLYIYIYIYI